MTKEQAKSELMQIYGSLSEEKKQALDVLMAQADGEYDGVYISYDLISRQAVIDCFKKWQPYMATRLHEFEKELSELPSVAIPQDHDGCKDCKYETYLEYYYPCCECKHNYNDFWKFKPHWKPYLEEGLTVQCSECGSRFEIATKFCPRCGVYNGEEIER